MLRARALLMTVRLLVVCRASVQHSGGNSHLRELRGLVLHERDERRDDHRGRSETTAGNW